MTEQGTANFWEFFDGVVGIIAILLIIGVIASFFASDSFNAIIMALVSVVFYFVFVEILPTGPGITEGAIDDASNTCGWMVGCWFFARTLPTWKPEYEYSGSYLIFGTLYDEFIDSNFGRGALNAFLSVLIGVGVYFASNYFMSNDMTTLFIFGCPIILVLICVVGFIKSLSY